MLASQRHALIVDTVRRAGGAKVSELTSMLGVSDMTVRRDLEQLAAGGLIRKVHGGAVPGRRVTEEPGFEKKRRLEQPAKLAIAAHAATLVQPGSAVALSAGTTTWAMAAQVARVRGLTVVTNSTTVADTIATTVGRSTDQTVILTGGVRTPSAALVGPVADQSIGALHVDQLFLGVHGFDPEAGFTTPNLAEAQTNRMLIAHAREVVVVADSTKWGTIGLADFGPLTCADVFITDAGLPPPAREQLAELVGELVVVDRAAV